MDLSFLGRVDLIPMHSQFKTQSPNIHSKEDNYYHGLYHSVTKPLIWGPPCARPDLLGLTKLRNRKSKANLWKVTLSKSESDTTLSGRTKQDDPSKVNVNGRTFSSNTHQKKSKVPLVINNGGAVENSTGLEQLGQVSSKLSPVEELRELKWAANRSNHAIIHQDAQINGNYMRLMQDFYLRETPLTKVGTLKEGLGIVEFLKGKKIFITGATGFLAKVLVEKILRVQPDIGHLFLLIKADDIHSARRRLKNEIMDSNLFKFLQSRHGKSYEEFMEGKLIPIVGNINVDNLGMDRHTMDTLRSELDIVVNSAASTTFDERYDHALNLNTKGAQRIVEFGKSCPHLQLLMHVSTAFANGERKGLVHEQTFKIGCSIANETLEREQNMTPDINVETELNLIQCKISDVLNKEKNAMRLPLTPQKEKLLLQSMKELGMERAKLFGWQDTYVFTKAMGEMLVDSSRDQLPVVIVRPSVVESSFKDPFPGWMEGNRMMDPIIISYGKGQLPGFLVDPKSVLDVVPVDMVANAMLAAMAKHACKPGLEVYQVASSVVNPLVFSELARMSREHFEEHPFMDSTGKPVKPKNLQLFQDMESFMDAVSSSSDIKKTLQSSSNPKCLKRSNQLSLKVKEQAAYLANLYRPYTFYAGRFDISKTQQLYADLSSQEKQLFGFNAKEIDWENYIKRIHIPGLRKHVLKGRGSTMRGIP